MDGKLSRRHFFKVTGSVATASLLPASALGQPAAGLPQPFPTPAPEIDADPGVYLFFTAPEAEFVTAAVDRLIPADEQWPSASQAGVVTFIDRQLSGAYGSGERLYLKGPWQQGTPSQGYQLPLTPAQLYRIGIAATERTVAENANGRRFAALSAEQQDEVLSALETAALDFEELPAPVFFETLLSNTIEGFFSDPVYGGNRNMVGWRMVGFPGAYANFIFDVDNHGARFDRPPISMGQAGR